MGLGPLKIAAIIGDDVLAQISPESPLLEGGTVADWPGELIAANAYLGAEPLVHALAQGADIVITGRVADPSLVFGADGARVWVVLAGLAATGPGDSGGASVGMRRSGQRRLFRGSRAKDVAGLADLGFPFADVAANGEAVVSKLSGTGGCVTPVTCKEQLLYELHDPAGYLTPDVTADFRGVRLEECGADMVAVSGGRGTVRPEQLKVTLGYREGYFGEGQISYAGPGCAARGRLALGIVEERLRRMDKDIIEIRLDLIGVNSVAPAAEAAAGQSEVRARVAARTRTPQAAVQVGREVEALYTNGPAGGGGVTQSVKPVIAAASMRMARAGITPRIHWEAVS